MKRHKVFSFSENPGDSAMGQQAPAVTSQAMRIHGDNVLDAPLAFLDEMEKLPELPGPVNGLEAALIDPTATMLCELLAMTDGNEAIISSPEPPVTTAAVAVKKAASRVNKPRKKSSKPVGMDTKAARKHEIEFLRTQVQQLEGELSRLHECAAPPNEPTLWEDIAKRQRNVRKRLEVENTRLRMLYEGQLKVARGLVRLLHRGYTETASEWGNIKRRRLIDACADSEEIFRSIRRSMSDRPVAIDEWMEESGIARTYDSFDDQRVRCGADNAIFLEMLLCRRFPFPFEATVEAVWKNLCADHVELENGVYSAVERSDTHLLARSKMGMKMQRLESSLEFYVVGQRVNQNDRVVVTTGFRSFTSSKTFGGEQECLEEAGYIVIERDPSSPLGSTILRSCKRSWPQLNESEEPTLWEDIAKRQRDVKQQAEVENMKLRELYEGQLKVARGLMRLLHKGQNDLSLQLGNVKRERIIEAYESADEIFRSVSASLAARPNTMDEWMHENGLAGRHDRYDDARVRCGPKNDFFLEVMLCRRLPFSFEATVEAVWNTFSADHIETNNVVYGAVERSDKHHLVQSKVGMKLRRLDAVTELYAVGRRSNETNRMMMTAESRSITSCASFRGKRECLDEVTYLVVERDLSRPQPSTVVRSCKRSWPQLAESDGEDVSRSKLELLADMLIDVCNGNCRAMFQQIENSLLLSSQARQ
ncbi:hypothetical protein Poli38472_004837 [Pythium oligandrum]|uniref:Uncharacterized protein n=1 Tax=Pythium oligandrum TaxID=41045 RepID=A0A8K1CBS8_PYTOL|nr:hypothetical protein Poli38472_004837 [Pythium oligandrum]|eukprot:TMW59768.1 hypothetical protein Poli38472_004837 [Pythium oligandrum]